MIDMTWETFDAWIREENGASLKTMLTRKTRVQEDLHVTGDEAVDFIEHFFNEFSIDYGDYDVSRYFAEEGFSPLEIIRFAFSRKKRAEYHKQPLTLGMLYQAALDGRWNCERIENKTE